MTGGKKVHCKNLNVCLWSKTNVKCEDEQERNEGSGPVGE